MVSYQFMVDRRRSVRVVYCGRRWWYQPQALVAEKSGLIETAGVRFLCSLLRAHAYDHRTLSSLRGKPVAPDSCSIGDFVRPKKIDTKTAKISQACFGRVVSESACASGPLSSQSRDSRTVTVEFVDPSFAESTGSRKGSSSGSVPSLEVRHVRGTKLLYSSPFDSTFPIEEDHAGGITSISEADFSAPSDNPVSDRVKAEIAALSRLDRAAMESMSKECRKSRESLAGLFSVGLVKSVISAIDVAERQMNSLEPREDLPEKIALLGKLSRIIANQLFSERAASVAPEADTVGDSPSPVRESAGRARRMSVRELIARGQSRNSGESRGSESQQMAVLEQRRDMLLSLMSRSRRMNQSYFSELLERENAFLGAELANLPLPNGESFGFGSFAGLGVNVSSPDSEGGTNSNPRAGSNTGPQSRSTFLDSILRCQAETLEGRASSSSLTHATFVRHLINSGILINSDDWVKACIDSQGKKVQLSSARKSAGILRGLADEEGTSVLHLALSFGCAPVIIGLLISRGASVGKSEIEKAAVTDQPKSLSVLLMHASYPDELDSSGYSARVQAVLAEANTRRQELDRKMREEAGAFMVELLRRLLRFCLTSRRRQGVKIELSNKAIAEILVGNVLLRDLQKAQKVSRSEGEDAPRDNEDESERAGRVIAEDESSEPSAEGLLTVLPKSVLAECIFSDVESVRIFLCLVEDHLSSKDMSDGAAGLAMLSTILKKFPELRRSSEISRFGVADLIAFQDGLAARRVENIRSSLPKVQNSSEETTSSVVMPGKEGVCVVRCPQKHTAVIHITRHSSFRCDVCGKGVDRGRPMHGCRHCDWDACECCTDKTESGLTKCFTIRCLSADCSKLLSNDANEDSAGDYAKLFDELSATDGTYELIVFGEKLMTGDPGALRDLGSTLRATGRVSMYQFMNIVLPALHTSLLGRPNDSDLFDRSTYEPNRRSKRARVLDAADKDVTQSADERLRFCKSAILALVFDDYKHSDDNDFEMKAASTDRSGEKQRTSKGVKYSGAAQELLRRLHQVLTMHERAHIASSVGDISTGQSESGGGDLQSLTKPIEISFAPSALADTRNSTLQDGSFRLQVEPLVPVRDLQRHILRTCISWDQAYVDFCER